MEPAGGEAPATAILDVRHVHVHAGVLVRRTARVGTGRRTNYRLPGGRAGTARTNDLPFRVKKLSVDRRRLRLPLGLHLLEQRRLVQLHADPPTRRSGSPDTQNGMRQPQSSSTSLPRWLRHIQITSSDGNRPSVAVVWMSWCRGRACRSARARRRRSPPPYSPPSASPQQAPQGDQDHRAAIPIFS